MSSVGEEMFVFLYKNQIREILHGWILLWKNKQVDVSSLAGEGPRDDIQCNSVSTLKLLDCMKLHGLICHLYNIICFMVVCAYTQIL